MARTRRLEVLRKGGADVHTVFAGGPAAVALWGSPVTGLAPARLHALRVAAFRSRGPVAKGTALLSLWDEGTP